MNAHYTIIKQFFSYTFSMVCMLEPLGGLGGRGGGIGFRTMCVKPKVVVEYKHRTCTCINSNHFGICDLFLVS